MEMSFSPSFMMYPDDWFGSTKVAMMTLEEKGAYFQLLLRAWGEDDCMLPDDDHALAALSGMNEKWFNGPSAMKIKRCFVKKGKKLYNERLMKERKRQEHNRAMRSKAGKASGKSRAEMSELEIAWADFIQHRKEMKRPLTTLARQRAEKKLEEYSNGDVKQKISIINQSIDKGWQGLFPLKDNQQQQQNPKNPAWEKWNPDA